MFTGHEGTASMYARAERIMKGEKETFGAVCELLALYGSDNDPIFYKGKETYPTELAYTECFEDDARKVRISYYGTRNGKHRLIKNGTIIGMLKDRANIYRRR